MNKTFTIATIALVAAVMGMSSIVPMIPQAYAEELCPRDNSPNETWKLIAEEGSPYDRNGNGKICVRTNAFDTYCAEPCPRTDDVITGRSR